MYTPLCLRNFHRRYKRYIESLYSDLRSAYRFVDLNVTTQERFQTFMTEDSAYSAIHLCYRIMRRVGRVKAQKVPTYLF